MEHEPAAPDPARLGRMVEQAGKMVASGRLTAEEAERLRADPAAAEKVLRDIRARHAGERLEVAVAEGAMTRQEADDILERVRSGEHSPKLRSHLAQFRPRRRPKCPPAPPSSDPGAGEGRPA